MSTTTQPPKHKRRWYQFSLMTLLVVMVVSCFGFAWIGWRMQRARVNRERVAAVEAAVAAIEKSGGYVERKYEELRPQTWLEEQFDDPCDADDPIGVLRVTGVYLGSCDVDLKPLKTLTDLEVLDLYGANITATGLANIKGLTNLRILILEHSNVTDAGLAHLKGLESLELLVLNKTNVSDAGLKHLKRLSSLEELSLNQTKVTDAGLEHLKGLANLKELEVYRMHVTWVGANKLQRALPACQLLTGRYRPPPPGAAERPTGGWDENPFDD